MDKSVEDIIKEAMEKKNGKNESNKPGDEKKQGAVFGDTSDYLISDIVDNANEKHNESAVSKEPPKAADNNPPSELRDESEDKFEISNEVFDNIINSRKSLPEQKKENENKNAVPEFLADNYSEDDEDLASLGVRGKEGKKITDYKTKSFKKDSPDNFDKAYYDKYDKLKKLEAKAKSD